VGFAGTGLFTSSLAVESMLQDKQPAAASRQRSRTETHISYSYDVTPSERLLDILKDVRDDMSHEANLRMAEVMALQFEVEADMAQAGYQ